MTKTKFKDLRREEQIALEDAALESEHPGPFIDGALFLHDLRVFKLREFMDKVDMTEEKRTQGNNKIGEILDGD